MKKWIVFTLLTLVAIATVTTLPNFRQRPEPAIVSKVDVTDVSPEQFDVAAASVTPISAPKVDSKQLLSHIKALNYKRYGEKERDLARDYLTQSLKKFGWSPTLQPFESGVNVLATRPGTDPQAGTVLVAAHYDTVAVSPGADDNSTGVAVVLELARLFSSRPTPRTLQLALFDQEEKGLLGSRAFTSNKANLDNLQGVIVMDMVGFACHTAGCQKYPPGLSVTPPSDRGDFLAVVGDLEHSSLLEAFPKSEKSGLPPILKLPVPFKGIMTPDVLRSDHAPFWSHNIGAVLLTDTANLRTPHYHQPSDKPATLDRAFFTGSAQIVANATTTLLDNHK